ncbi:MAG TPA: extensin family protein [Xanthobacteraceae bacterium]|nr:extensin family protein [Xanthobacteraceae bacterium]
MRRGLCFSLVGVAFLGALAGCGRSFLSFEEREAWRHEAEVKCLKSGAVKEGPALVRVSPIDGPGICGADFPLKVAALGESPVLAFGGELRPPGAIPKTGASQPRWPVSPPPAETYAPAPIYHEPMPQAYPAARANPPYAPPASDAYVPPPGSENYLRAPVPRQAAPNYAPNYVPNVAPGEPISLRAPGIADLIEADAIRSYPPDRSGGSVVRSYPPDRSAYPVPKSYPADRPSYRAPAAYPPDRPAASAPQTVPALGPVRGTQVTGSVRPVEVTPNATLACPIVSALDQWIAQSVQPAAMRWFGQPVAEIKQISAYSCRGMNGQPGARISEHAFGNALDIAAFTLADGRKVVVRSAWNGAPEEQGFLRDIQGAACQQFTTVLAPGSNRFHYDHIHVDLMRRPGGHQICNPAAMSGEVAAARAAQQKGYARRGDPSGITGSIDGKRKLADLPGEDDDHRWVDPDAPARQSESRPRERFRDW